MQAPNAYWESSAKNYWMGRMEIITNTTSELTGTAKFSDTKLAAYDFSEDVDMNDLVELADIASIDVKVGTLDTSSNPDGITVEFTQEDDEVTFTITAERTTEYGDNLLTAVKAKDKITITVTLTNGKTSTIVGYVELP